MSRLIDPDSNCTNINTEEELAPLSWSSAWFLLASCLTVWINGLKNAKNVRFVKCPWVLLFGAIRTLLKSHSTHPILVKLQGTILWLSRVRVSKMPRTLWTIMIWKIVRTNKEEELAPLSWSTGALVLVNWLVPSSQRQICKVSLSTAIWSD